MSSASATCLHLVAGDAASALGDCDAQRCAGDAVVFLDVGVLHLLREGETLGERPDARFLAADLRAHGLADLARRRGVSVIDDAGFCALLAAHRHCLTWA